MGSNHDLLLKYLNNLSSKYGDVKYFSIFVGILVLAYGSIALKVNNVAALLSTIIICISYLIYDIIVASEFTKKLTKRIVKKSIRNEIKEGDKQQKRMEEDLTNKNKTLSEENEELKRHLKRVEQNSEKNLEDLKEDLSRVIKLSTKTNENLRDMEENIVSTIKSERAKSNEFVKIQINNSKWWVFDHVKAESERMMNKVISVLDELVEKKAEASRDNKVQDKLDVLKDLLEVSLDNRVHEKLDALKDSFDEHFMVNEWGLRKAKKDDGYQSYHVVKNHFCNDDYY